MNARHYLLLGLLPIALHAQIPLVSFHKSMSHSNQYKQKQAEESDSWRMMKASYEYYVKHMHKLYQPEPRIPKIIHQIWVGSPLPAKETELCKTWRKYHPDWLYILWRDEDIEQFGLYNKDLYDKTKNFAEKSDIARYEILERIGGLYVDTDFVCFKPFDDFVHTCDFFASPFANTQLFYIMNSLIASVPHHPIMQSCVKNLRYSKNPNIMKRTGPGFLAENIARHMSDTDFVNVIFPITYFYPLPNYARLKQDNKKNTWIKPESYAMHYWRMTWKK